MSGKYFKNKRILLGCSVDHSLKLSLCFGKYSVHDNLCSQYGIELKNNLKCHYQQNFFTDFCGQYVLCMHSVIKLRQKI